MNNPWENIDLNIYETHMSSDDVYQLQTLSMLTKQQLNDYIHAYAAILGIAGGNGLEYIDSNRTKKIYGIDINRQYLDMCRKRYPQLENVLELICCDLGNANTVLPFTDIIICNLIIEYLGVDKFIELIKNNRENINIVSCVIQKNNNNGFVSCSNLATAFDPLMSIHNDIDKDELLQCFSMSGFDCIKDMVYPLPNGKEFIRMDFAKRT